MTAPKLSLTGPFTNRKSAWITNNYKDAYCIEGPSMDPKNHPIFDKIETAGDLNFLKRKKRFTEIILN